MKPRLSALSASAILLLAVAHGASGPSPAGPLSPRDELATFRALKGFKVELVACEPDVVDPVAMAFDPNGRLYVVEMHGYPNKGVGTGEITSGRIKLLEDRDGDGFFETCTTFAEKLRLPTSVMPYRRGVLVCNPPDIVYMEDSDGDGRADVQRVLYTGFNLANIQQMVNSLQWGLDNWVYGCAGLDGGTVRSIEKPDTPAVVLRSRGIRFRPDVPGTLEPTSGGGQFGLTSGDWGQWFTATNSQHLRHIVLPDHYLARNPNLPVRAVTLDIPDHGAACKVHRISPFEAWRVERTTRRKGGLDAQRFPATELIPGGFITSACSPLVYRADLFPKEYYGNTLVCDPANNLIHRDVLVPGGATFVAKRADTGCEFLASTDTWFRPVNLVLGPDGAVYIADFYREVIETPLSLPEDMKRRLNLESRGRGRIWRVVTEGKAPRVQPRLAAASAKELVPYLEHPNAWWRLTAQQLLVEKQARGVCIEISRLAATSRTPQGRLHALWTLHGLGALDESRLKPALKDSEAGVRENALKMTEGRLVRSEELLQAIVALANDPALRVRFQLAFTLGSAISKDMSESRAKLIADAWAKLAGRDGGDPWFQSALLSSASQGAPALLEAILPRKEFIGDSSKSQLLSGLALLVGAQADDAGLAHAFGLIVRKSSAKPASWQTAVLEGLGQGLQNRQLYLDELWTRPPAGLKHVLEESREFFTDAARTAADGTRSLNDRLAAVRLLAFGPPPLCLSSLPPLLSPQEPRELQFAAVRALSVQRRPEIGDILLSAWNSYSPAVRREVVEALFSQADRLPKLLDAIDQKKVHAGQLEPARLGQLRNYPDGAVRERARKVLAGQIAADRQRIVLGYKKALLLKGDAGRGKMVFQKTCSTCHRLENVGQEVGADLQSVLRNKTAEALLVDILDPSREVDPRYIEYVVSTRSGKVVTGLIAAETASSLTLRRAEKAEDTILRNQIESIQATAKSLMPDGLEMQMDHQAFADLIAYLQMMGRKQ